MSHSSFTPLILLLLALRLEVTRLTAVAPELTTAFVDVYESGGSSIVVLALSGMIGGGALFAIRNVNHNGTPRLVRVNLDGSFMWFSEHRLATGDNSGFAYYPASIVLSDPAVFVCGHITDSSSKNTGFIMKYALADGAYMNSAQFVKAGMADSLMDALLASNVGPLYFAGSLTPTMGVISPWFGTVDKDSLVISEQTLVLPAECTGAAKLRKLAESAGYYLFSGWCEDTDTYLWVGGFATLSGSLAFQYVVKMAYSSQRMYGLKSLDDDTYYGALTSTALYTFTSSGIASSKVFTGSYVLSQSPNAVDSFMIAGIDGSSNSFAFNYCPSTDTSGAAGATHYDVYFIDACKDSFNAYAWIAGSLNLSPKYGFVAKIKTVGPASCSAAQVTYLNDCYTLLQANCFGLCAGCAVQYDINACITVTADAAPVAAVLFAGRCATSAKHYDSVSGSCVPVLQSTSCHTLCGGECIEVGLATRCAHHCIDASFEPSIDASMLALNTCKCTVGTAFDDTGKTCQSCGSLCGSLGCGTPADNTKCVNCVSTASAAPGTGGYVICIVCPAGTTLVGGSCVALTCHQFCVGCSASNDNTACTDCISAINLVKTGTAAPYTCDCVSGTSYVSSSFCVYQSGCHPLCLSQCIALDDASACAFSCIAGAIAESTGTTDVYRCSCSSSTVYNGTACLPVLHSDCHPLCGTLGCTAAGDSMACLSCAQLQNVHASIVDSVNYHCSCTAGAVLTDSGSCVYESGCDRLCENCFSMANASTCVGCVKGITPGVSSAGGLNVVCACPTSAVYYNSTCVAATNRTDCHPFCDSSQGCVEALSKTKCVGGCSSSIASVVVILSEDADGTVTCGCANGTHENLAGTACILDVTCGSLCESCLDQDTCLACFAGLVGTVLSEGKCICAVAEGYVLSPDSAQCIQKSSATADTVKDTGYYPFSHSPVATESCRP